MRESWKRTRFCGEVSLRQSGETVVLAGWVQRRRDLGGLIFLDLRDSSGLVQVIVNPQDAAEAYAVAEQIRHEYVVAVRGVVRPRPEGTVNPKITTGEIEVRAEALEVLNSALTPPMQIDDEVDVDESIRLRYRYLDLRRRKMFQNLSLRHKVTKVVRDFLDSQGFLEIETPLLIKSTPEGARDFLVPSRLHRGKFYVLPQSPQLFKQLLMVAGVDRYMQIARCLRDEDLRADRQFEFTQIDLEMSFVGQGEILRLAEEMIAAVMEQGIGVRVPLPFPRLTYAEAMARYGTDKPDVRFDLPIHDLTDLFSGTAFRAVGGVLASGGVVRALRVPGCGQYSRAEIAALTQMALDAGGRGLLSFHVDRDAVRSPIAKHISAHAQDAIRRRVDAGAGDLIVAVADQAPTAARVLARLRAEFGQRLGLIDARTFAYVWVTAFPLVERDPEMGRLVAVHHPFTAPMDEDLPTLERDPLRVRAKAHDLVLNGVEIGGGSVRIHQRDIQERVFKLLGISPAEAAARFGFLLEALQYGAPPHGGIAFGLDRLIMVLAGETTIRDVIAFPKTAAGLDLLTGAPSEVDNEQLRAVHIRVE